MEFINKIELQGIVGNVTVNTIQANNLARFSLLVEETYKSTDGTPVIQSSWFGCIAWQDKKIKDFNKIKKGATIHLNGRVRMQRYEDSTGANRYVWEIVCQELEVLSK